MNNILDHSHGISQVKSSKVDPAIKVIIAPPRDPESTVNATDETEDAKKPITKA